MCSHHSLRTACCSRTIILVKKRASHSEHKGAHLGGINAVPLHREELDDSRNGGRTVLCKVLAETDIQSSKRTK